MESSSSSSFLAKGGEEDKERQKNEENRVITDENDSFLWFLRAVDSALDLFHEVVGGNRFERFGRHFFLIFFVLFLWGGLFEKKFVCLCSLIMLDDESMKKKF
jgi:hypothetical protein|tara:strand:+ start:81 stop:389 length:309 start_codon:yes stop_codon:yes gene_type:complete